MCKLENYMANSCASGHTQPHTHKRTLALARSAKTLLTHSHLRALSLALDPPRQKGCTLTHTHTHTNMKIISLSSNHSIAATAPQTQRQAPSASVSALVSVSVSVSTPAPSPAPAPHESNLTNVLFMFTDHHQLRLHFDKTNKRGPQTSQTRLRIHSHIQLGLSDSDPTRANKPDWCLTAQMTDELTSWLNDELTNWRCDVSI